MEKEPRQNDIDEAKGDELMEQGKFREAADEYAKALKPFQGLSHMRGIVRKQTRAIGCLVRSEPEQS